MSEECKGCQGHNKTYHPVDRAPEVVTECTDCPEESCETCPSAEASAPVVEETPEATEEPTEDTTAE